MDSRALVLDSDPETLGLVSDMLETIGCEVRMLDSPVLIYNEISLFRPRLILLGLYLKDFDAFEICAMIKKSALHSHIPVLGLGYEDSVQMLESAKLFDGVVSFPLSESGLCDLARRLMASD